MLVSDDDEYRHKVSLVFPSVTVGVAVPVFPTVSTYYVLISFLASTLV